MKDDVSEDRPRYAPSSFMRARRPYLYSDTKGGIEFALTREVLANHLDMITARNEENVFEKFARKLAAVEICPNLRPNTGPSGGGDGKVDTETYEVSAEIAERWYVGQPEASSERWAFAISAKKEWKGKVRSDVKKIVETDRGYTKIYFITSRNARAKDRADIEAALLREYRVTVTVLDQAWVLECVFEHGRVPLAVTSLGMSDELKRQTTETGLLDQERIRELRTLEAKIGDMSRAAPLVAEDMLEAALLARGLERPRSEIEGRFLQARRLAQKAGNHLLEYKIIYNWAWTANFWFDDFDLLSKLYGDAADLVEGLGNAELVSKLTNLWSVLRMAVLAGALDEAQANIPERRGKLLKMLADIAADKARPNSAMHARSLQLLVEMINRRHERPAEPMDDIWVALREVVTDADGYGTFPFEELADSLTELGDFIKDSDEFDELFSVIAEVQAQRRGEGEAATMLVTRGHQKLKQDEPYEAIRWFGKAIDRLVKKEFERELMLALGGLAMAYDKAGLWWAARVCALSVISHQITAGTMVDGSLGAISPAMLHGLMRMELSLGRVGYAMLTHQLELIVHNARGMSDEAADQRRHGNAMLMSALLIRTPFKQRGDLTRLPDILDEYALFESRTPTLFLLGRLEQLREEGSIPLGGGDDEVHILMQALWDVGPKHDILATPKLTLDDMCELSARILGIKLTFETDADMQAIQIAETILGVIESFLATSLGARALPNLDRLTVRVAADAGHIGAPTIRFESTLGTSVGVITYSPGFVGETQEDVQAFRDFCHQALALIIGRMMGFSDPERWLEKLAVEERVFDRALIFCNVPLMTRNVFGGDVPVPLALAEKEPTLYPDQRTQPWVPTGDAQPADPGFFGEGEPPPGAFDMKKMPHTAYEVRSPIEVETWNRAQWNGSAFMYAPAPYDSIPFLGLTFEYREAAEEIFAGWHSRIGSDDGTEHLRIAILRGADNKDPNCYGVSIGPPMHFGELKDGKLLGFVSRNNRMYPASNEHLEGFLDAYARAGAFLLVPFHLPGKRGQPIPIPVEPIQMRELHVRPAWEVGDNDPDAMGLLADDDPYIPHGIENPPVLRALARVRRMRKRS
jgi:tetratricopeptide (TPR) repeat protein